MRKTSYLLAGVKSENFKIDCRSLFGVGPADIMHVDYTQACRNVCMQGLLTLAVLAYLAGLTIDGLIQSSRNRRRLCIVQLLVHLLDLVQ